MQEPDLAAIGPRDLVHNGKSQPGAFRPSGHHLKAERCALLAKDEVDPRRRFQLETEEKLWLQIAVAEENLGELLHHHRYCLGLTPWMLMPP
jgi:hypothetical protein